MKIKNKIKQFFYESFRKRNRNDYQNLLTSGIALKNTYPWFYLRVFFLFFFTFIFGLLFTSILDIGNTSIYCAIGATFFGLSYFILMYEMIRRRELNIFKLLLIAFIGALLTIPLGIICSIIFKTDINFYNALRAGIGEEIFKGIASIGIVLIIQKIKNNKINPTTALLIGASVGMGFGIFENFDYIFTETCEYEMIETILGRGVMQIVTHIFWTALITYAFSKYEKPFKNYRFYLVVLFSMICHILWDIDEIPFVKNEIANNIFDVFVIVITTIYSIFVIYVLAIIIKKCNKDIKEKESIYDTPNEIYKLPYNRKAIIKALFTCIILSFLAIQFIYLEEYDISSGYTKIERTYYKDFDDFLLEKQDGYIINFNKNREYDDSIVDNVSYYEEGVLIQAIQNEYVGDLIYQYVYSLDKDENILKLYETRIVKEGKSYYEEYLYDINDSSHAITYFDFSFNILDFTSSDSRKIRHFEPSSFVYDNGKVYIEKSVKEYYPKFYIISGVSLLILFIGLSFVVIDLKKAKKELN